MEIARAIEEGYKSAGGSNSKIILNRRDAIRAGLDSLKPEEVLILTGKGPEKYLQIGNSKNPFSDAGAVDEWVREEENK